MSESQQPQPLHGQSTTGRGSRQHMEQAVGRRGERRLRAQRTAERSVWFGLGMFGVIGWSVSVPTLVGIAVGLWLDSQFQLQRSWTLMLMVAGLCVGAWNASLWIRRELAEHEQDVRRTNERTSHE